MRACAVSRAKSLIASRQCLGIVRSRLVHESFVVDWKRTGITEMLRIE
jgi:hypothetical protein